MKKIVIIGSGIGGIGLAALLKNRGDYDITVVEKNAFAGGKAASYERDGFVCDMGVHYCAMGDAGPLKELARRVGADVTFVKKKPFMRLQEGGLAFDFGASFVNPASLLKMAVLSRANPLKCLGAMRLFFKVLGTKSEKQAEPYDEVPLKDFLFSYIKDEHLYRFVETFAAMLLVLPGEEASAGEFLYSFGRMARAGSLCYPKGAFRSIPLAYMKSFTDKGGKVLLKEPVQSIQVQDGRVLGVQTQNAFLPADIVVSNAGIHNTVRLAGAEHFPKEYVDRVKKLKLSAGSVTLKCALDRLPYDIPLYMYCPRDKDLTTRVQDLKNGVVPEDPHMFMPIVTVSDPELAPPGKHLLIAGSMVPEGLEHRDAAEKTLENMERALPRLFPGFNDYCLWKHRTNLDYINSIAGRGAGEVIGLAQSYTQVGKNKPSPQTPVHGLWLVGTDAGGRGVGTEQAAHSALNVADMISRKI